MEWSLVAVRCRLLLGVDTQRVVLELLLRCSKGDGAKAGHLTRAGFLTRLRGYV